MNILLTGHTKGIGHEILKLLLKQNCTVHTVSRTRLTNEHPNLTQYSCDLSNTVETEKLCNKLDKIKFDAVILNAGYNHIKPADAYKTEEIIKIINVNFTSNAALIRATLPGLLNQKGTIIGLGSYSALEVAKWNNFYGASKAGFHHLLKNIFEQYRKQGLRVSNIIPDITNTAFYEHQDFEPAKDEETYINPSEIAELVNELLFNPKKYVPLEILIRPQKFEIKRKGKP
jgi:short-subunit dehydrogenase